MRPSFFEVLLSWCPILLLVFVWIWVMARVWRPARQSHQKMLSDQLAEMRRQNQLLERIAVALERRAP